MTVRVEIDEKLPQEIKDFISANEESVAMEVEANAKGSTAFKDETGYLRKHISAKKSKYKEGGWIVGAWAPHAWLVEHGHELINPYTGKKVGTVPPHAYLRPALSAAIASARAKFGVK